jgi:hypothetical protein
MARVWGLGLEFMVYGLGVGMAGKVDFRVWGLG